VDAEFPKGITLSPGSVPPPIPAGDAGLVLDRHNTLSGWGRHPVVPGLEVCSEDLEAVTRDASLTRGLGRAYGDAALPAPSDLWVAGSARADRLLSFDRGTGWLVAEAGLSLGDLYRLVLPRGFFTPVSPGTRFVTLGGMVAADVHGKNHHREGCIGGHIGSLKIRLADRSIVTCSPHENPDLFRATIGGMGLTGHILEVAVHLAKVPSPWIYQESERIADLDTLIGRLKDSGKQWPMTVGWVDCLARGRAIGRGTLLVGRWAESHEAPERFPRLAAPISVPVTLPDRALAPGLVRALNAAKFHAHRPRRRRGVVHPESFFYPLDVVGAWHRLYGPRGFVQYQCVLPASAGADAPQRFLELTRRIGATVFLCVVKDCGPEGIGLLSFPKAGMTLALDLPVQQDTQSVVDRLNEWVIDEGGRVYLAKDALTRPDHFRAMEPRLEEFLRLRRVWDPHGRIRSAQSVRLFGW
jgi:FAD/FMN-containing dehydrogenase